MRLGDRASSLGICSVVRLHCRVLRAVFDAFAAGAADAPLSLSIDLFVVPGTHVLWLGTVGIRVHSVAQASSHRSWKIYGTRPFARGRYRP